MVIRMWDFPGQINRLSIRVVVMDKEFLSSCSCCQSTHPPPTPNPPPTCRLQMALPLVPVCVCFFLKIKAYSFEKRNLQLRLLPGRVHTTRDTSKFGPICSGTMMAAKPSLCIHHNTSLHLGIIPHIYQLLVNILNLSDNNNCL